MLISKSDYLKYYQCAKALWLYKNRKDLIPDDIEAQMAGALKNGLAVEEEAYKLFPEAVRVRDKGFREGIAETSRLVLAHTPAIIQASFLNDDLYCRADILKHNPTDDSWDIYEVKSSLSVKKEYLPDVTFQKRAIEAAGLKIGRVNIIHINRDFVRAGEIDPEVFLVTEDVTAAVAEKSAKADFDIKDMFALVGKREEPKVRIIKQCRDPYPCMFIPYCWQAVPEHSIYNVFLNTATIKRLLDDGIVDLADVPTGVIVKEKYARYQKALLEDKILVDKNAIRAELDNYRYPLYFLDYETNSPGVPLFDNYRPYQRIIFQYSLHVIKEPGAKVRHFEYLDDEPGDPGPRLAAKLSREIGGDGSVVAWYKAFEAGCNKEMGERYPEYARFFKDINSRLLDLMEFFSKGYWVDKDFFGSASLKKVMPVFVPQLSYEELNISEGMAASESWPVLVNRELEAAALRELRCDMLAYCGLDTFALVEIFNRLNEIAE